MRPLNLRAVPTRTVLLPVLLATVGLLQAGTPWVGVVVSGGQIQINHFRTAGSATIFEANSVETDSGTSRIRIARGGWAQLGIRSSGRFFNDRVELDRGSVRISGYDATAAGLRIRPSDKAVGTVSIRNQVVEVSSIEGVLRVYDTSGATVASLEPGHTVNLEPEGVDIHRAYTGTSARAPGPIRQTASILVAPGSRAIVTPPSAAPSPAVPVAAPQMSIFAASVAPAAPSVTSSVTASVKVYPAYSAHGVSDTNPHGDDDDDHCISADRDCKHHGHDPGDDGHGHGNDDHDHGHGNDHDHGNDHGH